VLGFELQHQHRRERLRVAPDLPQRVGREGEGDVEPVAGSTMIGTAAVTSSVATTKAAVLIMRWVELRTRAHSVLRATAAAELPLAAALRLTDDVACRERRGQHRTVGASPDADTYPGCVFDELGDDEP
jgi:hypothetical protein